MSQDDLDEFDVLIQQLFSVAATKQFDSVVDIAQKLRHISLRTHGQKE